MATKKTRKKTPTPEQRRLALKLDAKRVRLARIVLDGARDYRGGCNGCDDFDMPDFMAPEDIDALDFDMHTWNGDPEEAGVCGIGWNFLFGYFRAALLALADDATKEPAP